MGSRAFDQKMDAEFRQLEAPVRFGDYDNGNYFQYNEDGTLEQYSGGVSQGTIESSSNIESIGSSTEVTGVVGGTATSNSASTYSWDNLLKIPNDPLLDTSELARSAFGIISNIRVVEDIGSDQSMLGIRYINYVQANSGGTNRGFKTVKIYLADSGWTPSTVFEDLTGLGTAVFDGDLVQGSNPSLETDILLPSPVTARYLIIDVTDNYGDDFYAGMRALWPTVGTGTYDIEVGDENTATTNINGDSVTGNFVLSDDTYNKLDYPRTTVSPKVSTNPKNKIIATLFDEGSGGLTVTGDGSAQHIVAPSTSVYTGYGSVKVTTTGTAILTKTFSSALDLTTHTSLRLRHRVVNAGNFYDEGEIIMRLVTTSASDYIDIDLTGFMLKRSWININQFMYADTSFATGATAFVTSNGTPDLSNVNSVEFHITKQTASGSGEIYFDELIFFEPELAKAQIILHWDDGFSTLPTKEIPLMQKYGMVGEIALVGNTIPDGSISVDYWRELQRSGWTIGNHTYNYNWVSATTLDELDDLFFSSWNVMSEYGFYGKDIFMYTDGDTQPELDGVKNLVAKYTHCARMTGDITAFTNQWPTAEPHRLYSLGLRDTATYANVIAAIDQAIAEKSVLILYCHYLTTGSAGGVTWNDVDYENMLSYLRTKIDAGEAVNNTLSGLFKGHA